MPPGSLNREPDQNSIFITNFLDLVSVSNNHEKVQDEVGYSFRDLSLFITWGGGRRILGGIT